MNEDYVGRSRPSSHLREGEVFTSGMRPEELERGMSQEVEEQGEIMSLAHSIPKDLAGVRELIGNLVNAIGPITKDMDSFPQDKSNPLEEPKTELGQLLMGIKQDIWNLQAWVQETTDRIQL